MFDPLDRGDGFDRRGNLKSNVTFRWVGEISQMSMRRFTAYNNEGEEKSEQYALDITDSFGFKCSFFRKGATREGVEIMMSQLPYDKTLAIVGEIAVRRGNTYFNARFFRWPDDTPFEFRTYQQEETGEDEPKCDKCGHLKEDCRCDGEGIPF